MIAEDIDTLDEQQLRQLLRSALRELSGAEQTIAFKQAVIDKLTHENAILKRLKFAAKSEAYSAEQKQPCWRRRWMATWRRWLPRSRQMQPQPAKASGDKQHAEARRSYLQTCRAAMIRHEPEDTDLRLRHADAAHRRGRQPRSWTTSPGVFTVERHIRGKWVCKCCHQKVKDGSRKRQSQAARHRQRACPRPACWPRCWWPSTWTTLPLYRQEAIFERAGHADRPLDAGRSGSASAACSLQPLVDALAAEELLRQPCVACG